MSSAGAILADCNRRAGFFLYFSLAGRFHKCLESPAIQNFRSPHGGHWPDFRVQTREIVVALLM